MAPVQGQCIAIQRTQYFTHVVKFWSHVLGMAFIPVPIWSPLHRDYANFVVLCFFSGDIHPVPFKDGKPAYYTLLHLYILADRFCFEGLRNRIVDLMADLADSTNSVLTPSDTRILYDLVVDGAMIKKLVLDLFAFKKTDKLLAEHGDRWHAGFLRDLCVHLKRPCEQAMQRHKLAMWYPEHDKGLLGPACENCRCVMTPRHGAVRCEGCGLVWCVNCVGDGVGLAAWEDGRSVFWNIARQARGDTEGGDEGRVLDGAIGRKMGARKWVACKSWNGPACKPWNGARCAVYHEHKETEKCEDVFMGP